MISFYSLLVFAPLAAFVLWRWPRAWPMLLALHLGFLTGLIGVKSDDPQLPVVLLLTFGLFIGFARPAGAWRWALALGLWLPALGWLAYALKLSTLNMGVDDLLFSTVALVPAFIGAYGGAFIRRASGQLNSGEL